MKKQEKSLRRIGAWALVAAMILGVAVPASPLSAEAAGEEPENLARSATATASEEETSDYTASKAIDGIINREAAKPQSRWATGQHTDSAAQWLKLDLGSEKKFQSFVIAWERTNIHSYKTVSYTHLTLPTT